MIDRLFRSNVRSEQPVGPFRRIAVRAVAALALLSTACTAETQGSPTTPEAKPPDARYLELFGRLANTAACLITDPKALSDEQPNWYGNVAKLTGPDLRYNTPDDPPQAVMMIANRFRTEEPQGLATWLNLSLYTKAQPFNSLVLDAYVPLGSSFAQDALVTGDSLKQGIKAIDFRATSWIALINNDQSGLRLQPYEDQTWVRNHLAVPEEPFRLVNDNNWKDIVRQFDDKMRALEQASGVDCP